MFEEEKEEEEEEILGKDEEEEEEVAGIVGVIGREVPVEEVKKGGLRGMGAMMLVPSSLHPHT